MSRRRHAALVVLAAVVLTGCTVTSQDDETSAPTPTPSASSSTPPALPATLPVGHGDVGPDDVVWAQGGVLHVGPRRWDLSPLDVDSLAVVPGGVFFLSGKQLWFTDLVRARATGITDATRLVSTADGAALRVTVGNPAATHAWDTATGRAVPLAEAPEPPAVDLDGPGAFSIRGSDRVPLVVLSKTTGRRVRLVGVVGDGFELVRWTGGTTFYGLALTQGRPTAVLACDLAARTCTTRGRVQGSQPVVVEGGG